MWNNFFKHTDIRPENTHILDGNAADLQAECDAFEEKIKAAGGIELFVGGELDTATLRPGLAWPAPTPVSDSCFCLPVPAPRCAEEAGKAEGTPRPLPWFCSAAV